jgi:hypothetical protein
MKRAAKSKTETPANNDETLRVLRHDINNQLSNILLALEQLRYEITDPSEDCIFYLNSISVSSAKINSLLNKQG